MRRIVLFISKFLKLYDETEWVEGSRDQFVIILSDGKYTCNTNNSVFTLAVLHYYKKFKLDGRLQSTKDFTIFSMKEFEIGSGIGRTHCVHRCEASWKEASLKRQIFKIIKNVAKHSPIIHLDVVI